MLGEIVAISENTLLIEGQEPRSILIEPDIANVVAHKAGSTLFIIDTGCTPPMREAIHRAAAMLRPFDRCVLLNSHGHPDHTGNNGIIEEIEAPVKEHFISRPGMPLLDFERYFMEKYRDISRYYHYLEGPRFPYSIFAGAVKALGRFNGDLAFLPVKKSLNKFKPWDRSSRLEFFESSDSRKLANSLNGWNGWILHDSVCAMEARGHSPDEIVFYLPGDETLVLADEAFPFFNCWPDSNSAAVRNTLRRSLEMARRGDVKTLVTGHDHTLFRGEAISAFLTTLLADYEFFTGTVVKIVEDNPRGITIKGIYAALSSLKRHPVMEKYFSLEFPKFPPFLKTTIASLLLERGFRHEGPEGEN